MKWNDNEYLRIYKSIMICWVFLNYFFGVCLYMCVYARAKAVSKIFDNNGGAKTNRQPADGKKI